MLWLVDVTCACAGQRLYFHVHFLKFAAAPIIFVPSACNGEKNQTLNRAERAEGGKESFSFRL